MQFSSRTNWHRQPNRLTRAVEDRRRAGKAIIDLTASNPTECGFGYPAHAVLGSLSQAESLRYRPDPRGLLTAREAVCSYYGAKGVEVTPSHVLLTASTSEAYSHVFKLLCEPGDNVLVPVPSYPLFEFLAQVNDVALRPYHLRYAGEWQVDLESMKSAVTEQTRAIVVVTPHNPTGHFLKKVEHEAMRELARTHGAALLVDEVFIDYPFATDGSRSPSTSASSDVLTFTLNGISKMIGLPQLKLGWIVVSGGGEATSEALERLEIMTDTFLSVNTPVQVALPALLREGVAVQEEIRKRVTLNWFELRRACSGVNACSVLACEGGWYGVMRIPRTRTDEEWALELLGDQGVLVFPGYFFEFQESGHIVLSLLPQADDFRTGVGRIIEAAKDPGR